MTTPQNRQARRRAASLGGAMAPPAAVRPGGIRALLDRAGQLRDRGDFAGALQLCQQAVRLEPRNPEIHFTAATVLEAGRDLANAVDAYRNVLKLRPGFVPALVNCAACLADLGELGDSIELYQAALKADPGSTVVRHNLAQALAQLRRTAEAVPQLRALAASRDTASDHAALAEALDVANDRDGALASYEKAMECGAPVAPTRVLMARVELVRGNLDAARAHLGAALDADPHDGHAHFALAGNFSEPGKLDEHISSAEAALAAASGKPVEAMPIEAGAVEAGAAPLHFALGRLNDRAGRYDAAFGHFEAGNALFADVHVADDQRLRDRARKVMAQFTADSFNDQPVHGSDSTQPVFVFGLPRSGTTLLEQILASHSCVAGLGERDLTTWFAGYLRDAAPERVRKAADLYLAGYPAHVRDKARVIDKSLDSHLEIGLILLMFPNARLINCLRHPLDVAFSAWSQYFAKSAMVYTYRFDRLAQHMQLYTDIMAHWHRTLPGRILDVRYEDLVTAPEATVRQAVAHLGLDWEPGCLDFHRTDRDVRTASIAQVRRPLYKGSLGHWRAYERHLQPHMGQFETFVAAYEAGGDYGWGAAG
ncbi:MAG TPA: sulfotransferase [Aestuariivirgaceae bacterium]|nr:sulfotransferase [Aestuariivirgaceae bacterium]